MSSILKYKIMSSTQAWSILKNKVHLIVENKFDFWQINSWVSPTLQLILKEDTAQF